MSRGGATTALALGVFLFGALAKGADLSPTAHVDGQPVLRVEIAEGASPAAKLVWRSLSWDELTRARLASGIWRVRFSVAGNEEAIEIPPCAGRGKVWLDAREVSVAPGSVVIPLVARAGHAAHDVEIDLAVGAYEHRVACAAPPATGRRVETRDGLRVLMFASAHASEGGGQAVVYSASGHDATKPAALLVGAHPWNGTMWTYAAYAALLDEARARDVVLLMPSGLGNSLYNAAAEDEVLSAIDALSRVIAVDPKRVSIWGASMGGAGATTVGLHHPDRFASITSFFGDSKYDLATYVRAILHDEGGAHLVNALDVVDNARNVPVWLIHGEDDRVSPIAQSEMLAQALAARHFAVRFDRVPHAGHEGALVTRFAAELVDRASESRAPDVVARVSLRSVRGGNASAYGVRIVPAGKGDAFIDVERREGAVHVLRATGVRAMFFARGAFGVDPSRELPIVVDGADPIDVRWDALP